QCTTSQVLPTRFRSDIPCPEDATAPYLDCGDLLEIEQLCSCVAAVPGDNATVVVNQKRNDKAESCDAVGNLTDLLARMGASVPPVGRELVDRNPANINHRLSLHGRHSEHERADRVVTDLQNLSGCFHPHCGRDHSRPLCNRLSPAASFPFTGSSRPTCLLPASRARPFQAAFHK